MYLKWRFKAPLQKFISKKTQKDCILQFYIFIDTKCNEIEATAFNDTAENASLLIKEWSTNEIKNPRIQKAQRVFNPTKCYYKLIIDVPCEIIPTKDNENFKGIKFSIIPLKK